MEQLETFSRSLQLQGNSFESVVERISQEFGSFDARAQKALKEFQWTADFSSRGPTMLVSGSFNGDWDSCATDNTPERLSFVRPHSGRLDVSLGAEQIEGAAGTLLIVNNNEAARFSFRGDVNVSDVLFFDWNTLTKAAAAAFDRPVQNSLGLLPRLDTSNPTGQVIAGFVDLIADGIRDNGPLLHSPIALSHMTDGLINLIINTVPHNFSQFLTADPREMAPWQVRLAIDFMHANIDRPITIQIVAHEMGISTRSLDKTFLTFTGMTPAVYLRKIRLEAAHKELLDRDATLTIKEVCLKWGFFHLGRFAESYRKAFGEMPSDTKRRANLRR